MSENKTSLDLTIIGAGMIVNDLLLPAALQMRREGVIGEITVVDMRSSAVAALRDSESIKRCFPDQTFSTCPAPGSTVTMQSLLSRVPATAIFLISMVFLPVNLYLFCAA